MRGLVRHAIGEIYFDKDSDSAIGGWIWFCLYNKLPNGESRGEAPNLQSAAKAVEDHLVKCGIDIDKEY